MALQDLVEYFGTLHTLMIVSPSIGKTAWVKVKRVMVVNQTGDGPKDLERLGDDVRAIVSDALWTPIRKLGKEQK
jgi:hypothetical protein